MKIRVFRHLPRCIVVILASTGAAHAQPGPDLGALTLPAAESLLPSMNRDIALARRVLQQAQADVITAGQKPNPQFSWTTQNINPNRGVNSGPLRGKTVDSIFRVDQLIERGEKAELRVATAQQLETAAVEDVSDIVRTQLLTLRGAYFDLLAAQEKFANATDAAFLYGKTIEAANLRRRAGDLAGADVARIQVDALRAQNDARAAEADLVRSRISLAFLIGADAEAARIRIKSTWPALDAAQVLQAQAADMVSRRPDVRAAQARVAASDKARELAQSLRKRDVAVGLQYEHWPNQADFNNQGTGNSFGVAVSVPLFLRHNHEGEIARAQADWYAARDFLEKIRAQALVEVSKARGDLESARDRLVRFETELLPQAEKSAAAAEFAFRNGAIGVMDLLDARRTLKIILIDASTARADHAKARAAWQSNTEIASIPYEGRRVPDYQTKDVKP